MTIGSFTLVRNEVLWIRAHILSWLPWLDECVFFDGNSTDGTLEVIRELRESHKLGNRIKLFENRDCANLQDDYVRVFNECLRSLSTDYAIFAHCDMILDDPGNIRDLGAYHAYTTNLRSFAGEPGGDLLEVQGRGERWKNIYRLNDPDLGAHYFGHYGAWNEDFYFSEITGKEHIFHGQNFDRYPYRVGDSWVKVLHYSDVRPYERRLGRMLSVLKNQGLGPEKAMEVALKHPRVTLQSGEGFAFSRADYHPVFKEMANV